jgi:hypothetical protein
MVAICGWLRYRSGEPFTYQTFNALSSVLMYRATLNLSVYNIMWQSQYLESVKLQSHINTNKEITTDCNMLRQRNKTWYMSKHVAAIGFVTIKAVCLQPYYCVFCSTMGMSNIKGQFTHSMPWPCHARATPMPFVNSHMPCRTAAVLWQCRVVCESLHGSQKYPNC